MRKGIYVLLTIFGLLLVGCASVPMANIERDNMAKTFAPQADKANIYVYRNETFGAAIKLPVALDGRLVGDTASKTYFLFVVPPGEHKLITKAENDSILPLMVEAGRNYFVWQEIKMGLLAARANLQLVDESTGRKGVEECKLIEETKY
jgi:hypothetical protein